VSLGGILGSLLRWQISEITDSVSLTVFVVNQLGVLVAGVIAYRLKSSEKMRLFWITGFAGGFTTMSSLAYVLSDIAPLMSIGYATATLLTSLAILKIVQLRSRS
jgi:CrcB protein